MVLVRIYGEVTYMVINTDKINWIRIEQGLSMSKLAEKSVMSKATVSRLLKNKTHTRPDTVGRIAKALNVPVKELYIF